MTFSGRNLIHFFQISIVVLSLIAAASAKSIQSGEQITFLSSVVCYTTKLNVKT